MPVYDPEKTKEYIPGSHDDLGVHPEHAEAEAEQLQRLYDQSPETTDGKGNNEDSPGQSWWDRRKNRNKHDDTTDLKEQEERPESKYGNSALDDVQEKLGLGFTGKGSEKNDGLSKAFKSKSNVKKRLAVAAAAGGIGAGGSMLAFFLMLPLKIESFVGMIEGRAMASTQDAMQKGMANAYSHYLGKHVMRALGTPGCKSTIDPGCVVTVPGTNPIAKMYQAWSQGKLQQELASKHGIVLGKNEKSNKFYMTINGHSVGSDEQFLKLQKGEITIFDLDAKEVKRSDIRRTLNTALKEGTLWDRTYKRYQYGKLLETRFKIKRCLIACDARDTFAEKNEAKLLAGKLWLTQKVSGLAGETYGLLLDCIVDPNACDTSLEESSGSGEEKKSRFQKELDTRLAAYTAKYGSEKLASLATRAGDVQKLGLSGYLTKQIAEQLGKKLGIAAAGEVTEKLLAKVVPYIGWASFAIDAKTFIEDAPSYIGYMRYSTSSATAASTFVMYQSATAEMKSGHTDLTALGSLADTLSADQDMTTHPIYENYLGKTTAYSGGLDLFGLMSGNAAALAPNSFAFKCDDGGTVPQGKQACPEEDFSNPGEIVATARGIQTSPVMQAINFVQMPADKVLEILNKGYKGIIGLIGTPAQWALENSCRITPGCQQFTDWAGAHAAELFQWLVNHALPNQWLNLSGGRLLAMSTAGAEVTYEKAAMLKTGAAPITNTAYTDIQRRYIADEEVNFQHRSLLGRLASTDTPYSLLSRIAMRTPSRSALPATSIASVLQNPLQRIGFAFGVGFTSKKASALTVGSSSAFGVKHYGYGNAEIPSDPEQYWDDRCEGRNFEQEFLDGMVQDQVTGEATPNKSEPCLLIRTLSESGGGMFDASLLPAGSSSTSGSNPTSVSGSTIDVSQMFNSSESVGCAPGTRDLGLQDGYRDGQKVVIRLCAIPGFKSTGAESGAESTYAIRGADGDVMVNSRVSGAWLDLYTAAKSSGTTLSAVSGFRSMAKQQNLWIQYGQDPRRAARPGYSPHQMGLAIDLATISSVSLGAQTCETRVTQRGNAMWEWMEANAARFGIKQYSAEAWHWDPLQMSNRCGGGWVNAG